jgi:pilus assembly protein Flp/PilA
LGASRVEAFVSVRTGVTAIERGPVAAGIAVVVIAVVNRLGSKLAMAFSSVATPLNEPPRFAGAGARAIFGPFAAFRS